MPKRKPSMRVSGTGSKTRGIGPKRKKQLGEAYKDLAKGKKRRKR